MVFTPKQIAAAVEAAQKQIRAERGLALRAARIRQGGFDTHQNVARIAPAIVGRRKATVREVQIALEQLGFGRSNITTGLWAAVGNHTLVLLPDFRFVQPRNPTPL